MLGDDLSMTTVIQSWLDTDDIDIGLFNSNDRGPNHQPIVFQSELGRTKMRIGKERNPHLKRAAIVSTPCSPMMLRMFPGSAMSLMTPMLML